MSPICSRLFRIVSRAFCIGLLMLPLIAPPAEAAAKRHKAQAKPGQTAKKHKQPSGKQTKAKKAKVHAKKPVAAPKKHVAKAARTTAKASPHAARPMARNARVPASAPVARAVPMTTPRAIEAPARTEKPRHRLAAAPVAVRAAQAQGEPPRHATQVCRREGRIYLLADCTAPLPPALLATVSTTGVMR